MAKAKRETTKLDALIGLHKLTGVDYQQEKYQRWSDGPLDDCQCMRIRLDGKTYIAVEDPSDGYRSSLQELLVSNEKPSAMFDAVQVFGAPSTRHDHDTIILYCVENGKPLIEVGTHNHTDYYPSFVSAWWPKNLPANQTQPA